jgi:PmbA protein
LGFDPRIRRSDGANYGEALSSIWIANSNGLFRHYRKSRANAGLSVIAEDGADKQAGEIDTNAAHWSDLPAPAEIGRRAGERAIRLIGGQPVETGRYPVVFSPEAGFALLIYVANALNGEFLSRKRSWLSDKFGAEIGSAAVTIRNDALRKGGLGSAPFDGEGINTRPITLVDAGHVSGRLLDLATALRLGATSTGSAQRGGYAALPAIGPSNLYLEPGTESADDLVAGVEKGLWVWGLNGWWIGLDPSNPQFSSAAFGLWIENGKPVRPVARVTIGGPLTEILGGIEAVGNDLVWDQPVKTPTFRTKPLLVSGT